MLDTKIISKLAEILDKTNLTELEYEDEGVRICLTRDNKVDGAPIYTQMQQPMATQQITQAPCESAAAETATVVEDYSKSANAVKSPMVGVVYLAPDPSSSDYVKIGDSVNEGDTVCLIEAMKTFNPVKAHKSGKVTKILVEGGDPAEYGEPLIIIE